MNGDAASSRRRGIERACGTTAAPATAPRATVRCGAAAGAAWRDSASLGRRLVAAAATRVSGFARRLERCDAAAIDAPSATSVRGALARQIGSANDVEQRTDLIAELLRRQRWLRAGQVDRRRVDERNEAARDLRVAADDDVDRDDRLVDHRPGRHPDASLAVPGHAFERGADVVTRDLGIADLDFGEHALARQRLFGVERDDGGEVEWLAQRRRRHRAAEAHRDHVAAAEQRQRRAEGESERGSAHREGWTGSIHSSTAGVSPPGSRRLGATSARDTIPRMKPGCRSIARASAPSPSPCLPSC